MKLRTEAVSSNATFSPCRRYRYTLERNFLFGQGIINFIMLNPSTADEHANDPTVGRCERMALAGDFNSMIVTNLFAYRATDPMAMRQAAASGVDVIGEDNDRAILDAAMKADMVICAWGNHGNLQSRSRAVWALLMPHRDKLHYLAMNQCGEPKHPLYIGGGVKPIPWGTGVAA